MRVSSSELSFFEISPSSRFSSNGGGGGGGGGGVSGGGGGNDAFFGFGGGPRQCPAIRFGMAETKLAIARIVRRYR